MEDFSPVKYISTEAPPTLIIHGDYDQVVPFEQSITLKTILDSLDIQNEFHTLENVNHSLIGATLKQKEDIQGWLVNFILRYYQPGSGQ